MPCALLLALGMQGRLAAAPRHMVPLARRLTAGSQVRRRGILVPKVIVPAPPGGGAHARANTSWGLARKFCVVAEFRAVRPRIAQFL
jgi:hypothetical protein